MDRNGQDAITDVPFRASAAHIFPLADLPDRARTRGVDPYAPVRLDFHELIAVRSGQLACAVDFNEHLLTEGDWLWVKPGQILQNRSDLAAVRGSVIYFQSGFLDAATATATRADLPPLLDAPLCLSENTRELLEHLLELLEAECGRLGDLPPDVHTKVMRHLVSVVLLHLAHAHELQDGDAAGNEAFRRFRSVVERDFAQSHRVTDYAVQLGYSVRTLTRASQEAVGHGAKRFIDNRVLLEAKRLLAHTDLPSSAVGERLGFPDATVFIKFFRNRTGQTPSAFRTYARGE